MVLVALPCLVMGLFWAVIFILALMIFNLKRPILAGVITTAVVFGLFALMSNGENGWLANSAVCTAISFVIGIILICAYLYYGS